jgi:hypothetical protein
MKKILAKALPYDGFAISLSRDSCFSWFTKGTARLQCDPARIDYARAGIYGGAMRDHRLSDVTPPGAKRPVGSRPSRFRGVTEGDRWARAQAAFVT